MHSLSTGVGQLSMTDEKLMETSGGCICCARICCQKSLPNPFPAWPMPPKLEDHETPDLIQKTPFCTAFFDLDNTV
jgi:hypothetical protein